MYIHVLLIVVLVAMIAKINSFSYRPFVSHGTKSACTSTAVYMAGFGAKKTEPSLSVNVPVNTSPCGCGSGAKYAECCEPLHNFSGGLFTTSIHLQYFNPETKKSSNI